MKKLIFLFLILLTGLTFSTCGPEEDAIEILSGGLLNFNSNGGSKTFDFTTIYPWTAKSNQTWCKVSPTSGPAGKVTLKITVDNNFGTKGSEELQTRAATETRTATITIISNGVEELIKVTQELPVTLPQNISDLVPTNIMASFANATYDEGLYLPYHGYDVKLSCSNVTWTMVHHFQWTDNYPWYRPDTPELWFQVYESEEAFVIAFRGTPPLSFSTFHNWVGTIGLIAGLGHPQDPLLKNEIESGGLSTYLNVAKARGKKIFLTGHSLGGHLAVMAYLHIQNLGEEYERLVGKVETFNAVGILLKDASAIRNYSKIRQWYTCCDIAKKASETSINVWGHDILCFPAVEHKQKDITEINPGHIHASSSTVREFIDEYYGHAAFPDYYDWPSDISIVIDAHDMKYFNPCNVNLVNPAQDGIITMTTAKMGEVEIEISGNGKTATVDWGDQSLPETKILQGEMSKIPFTHTYSNTTLRTITITGENITALICPDLQLTSLDVSQSTGLYELCCGNNQLTSLDISQNTYLSWLLCAINQLTSLDVSKNTALVFLYCDSNQLTNLDVSKNNSLVDLSCFQNQLTNLDVSKNTALAFLNCGANQLMNLDVSKNTSLVSLYCHANQLTNLDVSQNTGMIQLVCDGNKLTSLDVSKNIALDFLTCNGCQLTNLDVDSNTALTYLSCGFNFMTETELNNLFGTLHSNSGTKKIVIGGNGPNGDGTGSYGCDRSIAENKGWLVYD